MEQLRAQAFKQFTSNANPALNDVMDFVVPWNSILTITVENMKSGIIYGIWRNEDVESSSSGYNLIAKSCSTMSEKMPSRLWVPRGNYRLTIPGNSAQGITSVKVLIHKSEDRSVRQMLSISDVDAPIYTLLDATSAADGDITVPANYYYKLFSMYCSNDTQASSVDFQLYSAVTAGAVSVKYSATDPASHDFAKPVVLSAGDKIRMTLGTINAGVDTVERGALVQRFATA